jgi:hypothetical protein
MQRLYVSCTVRPIYGSLGAKGLRFRNLGKHFLKPGDFGDISINRILHSMRSV